jgi:hypothetical protein
VLARDAGPRSRMVGVSILVALFVVILLVSALVESCSGDDCDDVRTAFGPASNEYRQCLNRRGSGVRTGGGSYGGWSSGGGSHK